MTRLIITDEREQLLAEAAGDAEVRLQLDYSGRGMYGAKCIGIITDGPTGLVRFACALALQRCAGDDMAEELMGLDVRSDNLGHETIYYWPDVRKEDDR